MFFFKNLLKLLINSGQLIEPCRTSIMDILEAISKQLKPVIFIKKLSHTTDASWGRVLINFCYYRLIRTK